jgi:uncharacterized protein YuzE
MNVIPAEAGIQASSPLKRGTRKNKATGFRVKPGMTNKLTFMSLCIYNTKTDLLCIRLDDKKQQVINKRVSEDVVLDLGENNRIVGIEILDASKRLNLERLLPVTYEVSSKAV